jgi:hypothetical protein
MKMRKLLCLLACCGLSLVALRTNADLRDGLVSYWPLDSTDSITTPDIASNSNHMNLFNMSSSDFVGGVRGNAASFDGASKYLYCSYTTGAGLGLPVYGARYYTVSMWVKGTGSTQQSRAVFAEASIDSNNPLLALRTDTASANATNLLTAIVRNGNNNAFMGNTSFAAADQGKSAGTNMPFDNNWHHIAWVDNNGSARLYVDGVLDPKVFTTRLAEPVSGVGESSRTLVLNTISIGAIKQSAAGSFFNGLIDEVAVWGRALTQAEIDQVRTNGIPTPIAASSPTITNQPVGNTNLLVGEFFSLQALGLGTHPHTYQWYKDGVPMADLIETNEFGEITNAPIVGVTSNILAFTNLLTTDSGGYTVVISNNYGSTTSSVAQLLVSLVSPQTPNLTNGQVAYWPLDTIQGITTPDVVRGYDLYLYNMASTNLVSGKWGNAMQFYGSGMLSRFHAAGDALPANQYHDFTIAAWVNAPNNGGGRLYYTECRGDVGVPTFTLGNGDNDTTPRGPWASVRAFVRNDTSQNWADAGSSSIQAYQSNTWHHVVYRQRWVGGATPVLDADWFIDGVKDDSTVIGNIEHSPRAPLTPQNSSIGGRWRQGGTDPLSGSGRGGFMVGLVDDVAVWNRALTPTEILMLSTNVTPAAPPVLPSLAINSFKADFAQVVSGGFIRLSWNVAGLSGSGLVLNIDQGIGNVLSQTTNGIGSLILSNMTTTTTYTLTAQRSDAGPLTAPTTVAVVSGVAAGWYILDNFETYSTGPLVNPYWGDLLGGCTIENVGGNKMLNASADASTSGQGALLPLNLLNILQGQARTLFARIYVQDDPLSTTLGTHFGVTDKTIRTAADTQGDIGPFVRLNDDPNGDIPIGAINDVGSTVTQIPRKLEQYQVYNVWIDVTNGVFGATNTGDFFSVWVQRVGETNRLLILDNFSTDRDLVADFLNPITLTYLDKFVIANNSSSGTVYLDDVYLSQNGYNSTVPVAWAGPTPPTLSVPTMVADTVSYPGQIGFTWDAGALMSAPSVTGPWTVVPDSYGFFYLATLDTGVPQRYFRIQR